jgi:uncharacterized protein
MKHVLFIQGAGTGAYQADKELAESLQKKLGAKYKVHFPAMRDEDDAQYDEWRQQIKNELTKLSGSVALVGHSVGASILAKYLSETEVRQEIAGIFFIANPFWGGDGWQYEGWEELALPEKLAATFPKDTPVFLYHCRDDETVPFDHLDLYAQLLPDATVRAFDTGGHQFEGQMSVVAQDINNLGKKPTAEY